jgi:hypothetical protein
MIFLLEYDRSGARLVTFKTFDDSNMRDAGDARLELELVLNRRGVNHEVVILQAASEQAVRRTHRRYFESLKELVSQPAA